MSAYKSYVEHFTIILIDAALRRPPNRTGQSKKQRKFNS
jgi:hypothetical protein